MTPPRLLTVDDVAEILRVSPDSVYDYARDGRLASIRFGRSVRFRPEDVEAFITAAAERPRLLDKGVRRAR
jgi:excisionase family DNA binding protein